MYGCFFFLVSEDEDGGCFKVMWLNWNEPVIEQGIGVGFVLRVDPSSVAELNLLIVAKLVPRRLVCGMGSNSALLLRANVDCALIPCQTVSWMFSFSCALGGLPIERNFASPFSQRLAFHWPSPFIVCFLPESWRVNKPMNTHEVWKATCVDMEKVRADPCQNCSNNAT